MNYELKLGDNVETLKQYPDNYFDSIVTDPPYGIKFLGKDWDSKKATETTSNLVALQNLPSGMKHTSLADDLEFQQWMTGVFTECYRVLKPGGHLLAFSAARTYHHMAMAAQLAGYEIRDQLMWLYGSGFPKAQDIGKAIDKRANKKDPNYGTNKFNLTFGENPGQRLCKICNKDSKAVYSCKEEDCGQKYNYQSEEAEQWAGWKTALKPAHEPIVMARKPFKGSTIDNVLEHGVGAMNIDESRIPYADEKDKDSIVARVNKYPDSFNGLGTATFSDEHQSGYSSKENSSDYEKGRYPSNVLGEIPEYQNFFYSPKVSREERHIGFEHKPEPYDRREEGLEFAGIQGLQKLAGKKNKRPEGVLYGDGNALIDATETLGNNHPTVKPVELMKYLVKLVTPKGGKVLDPFNGSGSTGMACVELEYEYTGCELDPDYIEIATKRIEGWYEHTRPANNYDSLFDEE